MPASSQDRVAQLLPFRTGHFQFESGHHSNRWLDLELLCVRPEPIERLADDLAERLRPYQLDAVCGPLVEGAFVALMVASRLGLPFTYAERFETTNSNQLFPIDYRLPGALRKVVSGKRVGIVNDVISAGSAVKGTLRDLTACGAQPVVIGALAVLGSSAAAFAEAMQVGLETLAWFPSDIWTPQACPLCAAGAPLSS